MSTTAEEKPVTVNGFHSEETEPSVSHITEDLGKLDLDEPRRFLRTADDPHPEHNWGDLEFYCRLCGKARLFCPGCTGGQIWRVGFDDLFMGCGVSLRCPLCVGVEEAYADKAFMQAHYWDKSDEGQAEYRKEQDKDIERKYPGWSETYRPE